MSTADRAVTASNSAIAFRCVVLLLHTMSVTLSPCPYQWDALFDADPFFSAAGFIDDDSMAAAAVGPCERIVDFDVRHFCQQLHSEVAALTALVRFQMESVALIQERLASVDVIMAQSSGEQPPGPTLSNWVCPVCEERMAHRRSFKGHIKRLYEFHHLELFPHAVAPTTSQRIKHHCQLLITAKRHVNLVSRFRGSTGDFIGGSKGFSKALWEQVQLLTSSDDGPGGLPAATVNLAPVTGVPGDAPS